MLSKSQKADKRFAGCYIRRCDMFRRIGVFFLLLTISGCRIDFETQTVVEPDGSLIRTTRYVADEESDKDELEAYYDLPSGGTWRTETAVKYSHFTKKEEEQSINIYEVTKRYRPGESIVPDYARRGETTAGVSRNEIRLTVRNYVLMKTFAYEERYPAMADKQKAEALLYDFFKSFSEKFKGRLVEELGDDIEVGRIEQASGGVYDPLIARMMEVFREEDSLFDSEIFIKEITQCQK